LITRDSSIRIELIALSSMLQSVSPYLLVPKFTYQHITD
jgi:hypothetical protein